MSIRSYVIVRERLLDDESATAVALQLGVSLLLLQREFRRRLVFEDAAMPMRAPA